jgi:hypothetical protein
MQLMFSPSSATEAAKSVTDNPAAVLFRRTPRASNSGAAIVASQHWKLVKSIRSEKYSIR